MKTKVTSMSPIPGAKITKDYMGFNQPVHFTLEGREGNFIYEVTARKKKDLPRNLEWMQKRVDGYAGGVTAEEKDGRITGVAYMLC